MAFDISRYRDLYPFESRWVTVDGHRMHYVDEGEGEAVVLVHGNPTWSFFFRDLISGLRDQYRVIAVDHIGSGLSDKPGDDDYAYRLDRRVDDLESFLGQLALDGDVTLGVHDWGGMIAAAWALRRPERVARLMVFNTAAFLLPAGKSLPWQLWLARNVRLLATPMVLGWNAFARVAARVACVGPMSRAVRACYIGPYDRPAHRVGVLRFVQDIPLTPADASYATAQWVDANLHRLSHLPTLICWGERDFVFDADFLNEWRRRFPAACVHTFEAGHYVLEDAGDRIVPLVRTFLERHPVSSAQAHGVGAVS